MGREPKLRGESWMELVGLRARVADLERANADLERELGTLKRSEARFELVFRGTSEGLWEWDAEAGTLWWSPGFRVLIGYSEEELPASYASFQAILHPEDRARTLEARRLHFKESRPYAAEFRLRTKHDGYRWFLSRGALAREADGRPARMAGTLQDIEERKQTERFRERLVGMIEATTDFVGIINANHEIVYVNRAGRKMRGIGADEDVLGGSMVGYHPAWALRIVMEEGIPAAAERGVWVGETALLSADGREIPVSQLILAHKDEDGEVEFLATVARDIRALKQAEEALRENAEKLLMAQHVAKLGFVDFNIKTREVYWSDEIYEIFGVDRQELEAGFELGVALVHPDDREFFDAKLERAIEGLEEFDIDHRIRRPDGRIVWIHTQAETIRDSDGNPERLFGVVLDITGRKLAEEALRESEERYRSFVHNFPGIAFRGRMNLTPIFLHGAVEEITGYREADFLAADPRPSDIIHEADLWRLAENREFIARVPGSVSHREYRIVRKDGTIRWLHESARAVGAASGEPRYLEGILTDITERKRIEEERRVLEEQLRQAQKMEAVGRLAAGVAHDFNNVLTVILGNAEVLLPLLEMGVDERAADVIREGLEEVKTAGQRAAAITRQLLTFGRKETIAVEVLDPKRVIRDAEEMLRRLLREDIVFQVDIAPDVRPIRADPGHVEQLVMNLVLNARDAMPNGGTLRVTCANADLDQAHAAGHVGARPGPHVVLAVSDTGLGMSEETIEHIFEPFFTSKPMGKGTGLGLATVYGILRQIGAHVSVESQLERGSTFRVYLPALLEGRAKPSEGAAARVPGGNEVVLVCEDEEYVRRLICRILTDAGYAVLEAENGKRALTMAEKHEGPIHLLISDVVMPEMDGARLFQELVRSRPRMRVIFVSGYTDDVLDSEASWGKGRGFLKKPFTPGEMRARVREMLELP